MKIRSSFVSNSSSSSFICAGPKDEHKLTLKVELDMSSIDMVVKSPTELVNYMLGYYNIDTIQNGVCYYCGLEDTHLTELFKKCREKLAEDKYVYFCSINDDGGDDLLYDLVVDNPECIESEHY